jgi:hypothetical protein
LSLSRQSHTIFWAARTLSSIHGNKSKIVLFNNSHDKSWIYNREIAVFRYWWSIRNQIIWIFITTVYMQRTSFCLASNVFLFLSFSWYYVCLVFHRIFNCSSYSSKDIVLSIKTTNLSSNTIRMAFNRDMNVFVVEARRNELDIIPIVSIIKFTQEIFLVLFNILIGNWLSYS